MTAESPSFSEYFNTAFSSLTARQIIELLIRTGKDFLFDDREIPQFDEALSVAQAYLNCLDEKTEESITSTEEEIANSYKRWWDNEGSGDRPLPGHNHEEHARRMTEIAWLNGAYVAIPNGLISLRAQQENKEPSKEQVLELYDWMSNEWMANNETEFPIEIFANAVLACWGSRESKNSNNVINASGEAATLIPWLLEEAVKAADSEAPRRAGMLTLAAELLEDLHSGGGDRGDSSNS